MRVLDILINVDARTCKRDARTYISLASEFERWIKGHRIGLIMSEFSSHNNPFQLAYAGFRRDVLDFVVD